MARILFYSLFSFFGNGKIDLAQRFKLFANKRRKSGHENEDLNMRSEESKSIEH